MIEVVIIIILVAIVAFLSYLLYINYKRAERAEEYCEAYVRFVSAMYLRFRATYDHMKEVDRLGAFESDDEVGVIFKEIKASTDSLYEFITKYINADQEDEKTKN